ncbi:hypothetical protein [Micromonospora sp. KC723]|uniref:hypothetical protein n=1 Tax=Micromonospora sp. KC723 TaxID=2530381 RepID=UPI001FB7ADEB|nr:hypothetical protein [Micromonospora sp. KC723]
MYDALTTVGGLAGWWTDDTKGGDLRQDGDHTTVLFTHRGWREPVEFMHHRGTRWATCLMSPRSLVEPVRAHRRHGTCGSATWH